MTRRLPHRLNLCYASKMDGHATHWAIFDFSSLSDEALKHAYLKTTEDTALPQPQRIRSAARSHWAGRIVLKHLLESQKIKDSIQVNAEFGYPFTHQCHVSIAHTEKVAVAAISNAPVGIDLEKKTRPVRAVLEKLVTTEELDRFHSGRWVDTHGIVEPELYLWVGKEAVFQFPMFWLNVEAPLNMLPIFVTWEVFQSAMLGAVVSEVQFEKASDKLVVPVKSSASVAVIVRLLAP